MGETMVVRNNGRAKQWSCEKCGVRTGISSHRNFSHRNFPRPGIFSPRNFLAQEFPRLGIFPPRNFPAGRFPRQGISSPEDFLTKECPRRKIFSPRNFLAKEFPRRSFLAQEMHSSNNSRPQTTEPKPFPSPPPAEISILARRGALLWNL